VLSLRNAACFFNQVFVGAQGYVLHFFSVREISAVRGPKSPINPGTTTIL
jgi:hypothetical protein